MSRNKRKKNKPKIPQSGNKKVKGEDPRTSELIDGLKGVAIDWIEKPNLYLKTVYSIIWLYFIIRVFITDIDLNIATSYFSIDNSTYVIGRALLIALILMVYWQIMGTKEIIKYSILFFVFPFHPIGFKIAKFFVWRVPKYLIKKEDYYIIYSYIDVIISCIVHIKNRLTFLILFCIGIFLLTKLNGIYLYVPILIFVVLQISHIIKRYRETFSPIKVFQMKVVNYNPKTQFSRSKFDKDVDKAIEAKTKKIERKIASMEYFLMVGEFAKVLHQKISTVLNSRSYFKSFLFKGLYSFLFAMVIFGCINYCLFKTDPSNYYYSGTPKYFEFFYYSFFTIFPDGSDIEPLSRMAKVVRMCGVGVGVIVNLLILVVLVTVKSERYKENLQSLNDWANSYASEIAFYFEEKYGQKTADGLKFLIESGSETAKYLNKMKNLLK